MLLLALQLLQNVGIFLVSCWKNIQALHWEVGASERFLVCSVFFLLSARVYWWEVQEVTEMLFCQANCV